MQSSPKLKRSTIPHLVFLLRVDVEPAPVPGAEEDCLDVHSTYIPVLLRISPVHVPVLFRLGGVRGIVSSSPISVWARQFLYFWLQVERSTSTQQDEVEVAHRIIHVPWFRHLEPVPQSFLSCLLLPCICPHKLPACTWNLVDPVGRHVSPL